MTTPHALHDAALRGYQVSPDAYERGRPDYPEEVVAQLIDALEMEPGHCVIDVGAGTGKMTRPLHSFGALLLAVEPVERMRTRFRGLLPDVPVVAASAEAIPIRDGQADQVICAQAFHWFHGPTAVQEIHRVLKPQGHLGLIWNVRDESVPWVAGLTRIMDPYSEGVPRYRGGNWQKAFATTFGFTPLQAKQFQNLQRCDHQTILDRVGSVSFIAALAPEVRAEVLAETRRLLETDPLTAGRDLIDFPYRCDLYWCRRL